VFINPILYLLIDLVFICFCYFMYCTVSNLPIGIVKAIGKTSEAKIAIVLVAARVIIQSSRLQALKWTKRDYILDVSQTLKQKR